MGIATHPKPAPAAYVPTKPVAVEPARTLADGIRALATGLAAAADLRRLSAMNDNQLARLGLTRDGVPGELFDRHFAG